MAGSTVQVRSRAYLLRPETVSKDTVYRAKSIFDPNLFTFVIGSALVRDTYFIDTESWSNASNLSSNLGLKTETVFSEIDGLDDFTPENLKATFHVREV